jgi:hypothetical protein
MNTGVSLKMDVLMAVEVQVKVILRPVCRSMRPPSGTCDQSFFLFKYRAGL